MGPQLGYWLLSLALLAIPVLLYELLIAQDPDRRWAAWAERFRTEDPADPADSDDAWLAAEVATILRREQLLRDVERVRHLVATDAWMSAVRQIGNRMAYEQLLHDVQRLPETTAVTPAAGVPGTWSPAAGRRPVTSMTGGAYAPGGSSTVETIDFRSGR